MKQIYNLHLIIYVFVVFLFVLAAPFFPKIKIKIDIESQNEIHV
jgi:hypothetical protein